MIFPIQEAGRGGVKMANMDLQGSVICGHVGMDVAPKWFHFYHFLHRLGLLIQSSLLSSTVGLVVSVKIVFLKNII